MATSLEENAEGKQGHILSLILDLPRLNQLNTDVMNSAANCTGIIYHVGGSDAAKPSWYRQYAIRNPGFHPEVIERSHWAGRGLQP